MDCPTCEAMVDAYVDGELSAAESVAFESALQACPECRRRLQSARMIGAMMRDLPVEPAPDLLRARLERELRAVTVPSQSAVSLRRWRGAALAASLLLALGIGWSGGVFVGKQGRESDELMAGYLRVAMSDRAVEVASSDRHSVKPWFAGRIDYAPPVYDLTTEGFPLLGGRVDLVDGRKVAVLVYRRNQHKVVLTLWPATSTGPAPAEVKKRDGFSFADWRHAGFEMRAVADLTPAEMASFATALDRAVDADR